MDIWDIAKTVGTGLIKSLPMGDAILGTLNEVLPDGAKLTTAATGKDVEAAVQTLTAEQKTRLMTKQFDVQLEQIQQGGDTLREAIRADVNNPHTTRPHIAKWSFWVVALISTLFAVSYFVAILMDDKELVVAINEGWMLPATIIAPFVTLLTAYMGVLAKEKVANLNAANGLEAAPSFLRNLMRGAK